MTVYTTSDTDTTTIVHIAASVTDGWSGTWVDVTDIAQVTGKGVAAVSTVCEAASGDHVAHEYDFTTVKPEGEDCWACHNN